MSAPTKDSRCSATSGDAASCVRDGLHKPVGTHHNLNARHVDRHASGALRLPEPSVLRLFQFRPVGSAFDSILRDVMLPELRRMPGLLDVFLGRRGPDDLGPRLNASVWSSREEMVAAVGVDFDPPVFHPEYLEETTDRVLEILPLAISMPFDGVGMPRILRLFRGHARTGELDAYIDEARDGTIADIDAGRGPLALHLATGPADDDFLTLSVWESWSALEQATGGDVKQPVATRHPQRIERWDAAHFEVIDA
jgi:hypothetical protein